MTFERDGVHPKRLHRNHQIEIRVLNVTMPSFVRQQDRTVWLVFWPRNRLPGKRLVKRSFLETPWGRHWPSRNQWIELAKPTGDDLTQKPHGAFGPSQQKHEPLCASLVVRSRPPPSLPRSVVNWIPDAADRSPNRCETASNTRPTSKNRATPPTTMPEPSSVGESGQPQEAAPKERSGRYRPRTRPVGPPGE